MCDHNHDDDHHEQEHPRDRVMEPADPLLLNGNEVVGDPNVMLECLVEEFARMGMDGEQIMRLFLNRNYQATAGLTALFSPMGIRARIDEILGRCGVMRVRFVEPEDQTAEDETISLTVRGRRI